MSGELGIDVGSLAGAAEKAAATAAASVVTGISAPRETVSSQLDAALVLMGTAAEVKRQAQDSYDAALATKQATALAESPPLLAQQDAENAQNYPAPPQVWTI
jgi:hypothetical protein